MVFQMFTQMAQIRYLPHINTKLEFADIFDMLLRVSGKYCLSFLFIKGWALFVDMLISVGVRFIRIFCAYHAEQKLFVYGKRIVSKETMTKLTPRG